MLSGNETDKQRGCAGIMGSDHHQMIPPFVVNMSFGVDSETPAIEIKTTPKIDIFVVPATEDRVKSTDCEENIATYQESMSA